jgi:hypothetical protein
MCAAIHDGTQEASDSTPGGSPRCAAIHDCAQCASDLMQGILYIPEKSDAVMLFWDQRGV